jgi:hypothetical protein
MSLNNKFTSQSILTKLDSFGVAFNFTVNGRDRYQTVLGAFFTLLILFIFIALFFGLGIDLYQRKKPRASFNSSVGSYHLIPISNKNFTYAFRVENSFGIQIIDESVFYHSITIFTFEFRNEKWELIGGRYLDVKKCTDFPSLEEKEKLYNISLKSWYCLDVDELAIGGNWDGKFVTGIKIETRQCTKESGRICSSQQKIQEIFTNNVTTSNLFFSDLSMQVLPTMDDFENPLKTTLVNRYDALDLGLSKRKISTYKTTTIINDVGWIFSDEITYTKYGIDTQLSDFSLKKYWEQDILFSQFIYFGRTYDTYNRNYTKIQEVLASIGGFAKSFYFFIFLIYYLTYSTYKNLFLISHVRTTDEELGLNLNRPKIIINRKNKFDTTSTEYTIKQLHNSKSIENNFNNNYESLRNKSSNCIVISSSLSTYGRILHDKYLNTIPLENISYIDYFTKKFFKCQSRNGKVRSTLKKYALYEAYFLNFFDVLTYVNMCKEFREFKKIILKSSQIYNKNISSTDKTYSTNSAKKTNKSCE